MCGIFGVTADRQAPHTILAGLKRLEYRGYDSWGIAVKGKDKIEIEKHAGKISQSTTSLANSSFGIGHTRWATHGGATDANAHPHLDCTRKLAIVHNGIIDNWQDLKKEVGNHKLVSETDSEIVAHLIEDELKTSDLEKSFIRVFKQVHGFNALIAIHQDYPYIMAGKTCSPLIIGVLPGSNLIASDVSSLLPLTQKVIFLEDGQIAKISKDQIDIIDVSTLKKVRPHINHISWSAASTNKGKYPHFMLKEIHEQPQIVLNLLNSKKYEIDHLAEQINKSGDVYSVA
ncbi:MAG TPA: class II glutamine amidotransferase, partial [bacterium]|nr:class II glutamine amidotransferase [bacterium]